MENNKLTYKILLFTFLAAVVMIVYLLYILNSIQSPSNLATPNNTIGNVNLLVIFITGLTVGGLTCLAVQGGLLASVIASSAISTKTNINAHVIFATGAFLVAKLIAHILLGFILGAFGEMLRINSTMQAFMQLLAGIYMVLVALNLFNVHPIFRYVIIQPPRFLIRLMRNQSRSKDLFAPALLGGMTIFIPCGTTLAMEALAISSSNAFIGASIMGAFTLGTIPFFFAIGAITSLLKDTFRANFLKLTAIIVIYLGITSLNGALIALGSPITFQSIAEKVKFSSKTSIKTQTNIKINQTPTILITASGYSPNYIRVKKGVPVTLTLKSIDAYSCASAFRIPSLGIARDLAANEIKTITFTPSAVGRILFTCAMGMYRGVIEVI